MRPFFLALLFALAPVCASAQPPAASLAAAENASVIIYGDLTEVNSNTGEIDSYDIPICSGWIIAGQKDGETVIVTAGHCAKSQLQQEPDGSLTLEAPKPTSVQFFDGHTAKVEAGEASDSDDVAALLVRGPYPEFKNVPMPGGDISRGQDLFAFGMPNSILWAYAPAVSMQGSMASGLPAPWANTELLSCPACGAGLSGGGVWAMDGSLVGMVVGGPSDYPGAGGAFTVIEPVDTIIQALRGAQ